jgi:hypothetical protein
MKGLAYHVRIKTNIISKEGNLIEHTIAGMAKEEAEKVIDIIRCINRDEGLTKLYETKFIDLTKYANKYHNNDGYDYKSFILNRDCILEASIIKGQEE